MGRNIYAPSPSRISATWVPPQCHPTSFHDLQIMQDTRYTSELLSIQPYPLTTTTWHHDGQLQRRRSVNEWWYQHSCPRFHGGKKNSSMRVPTKYKMTYHRFFPQDWQAATAFNNNRSTTNFTCRSHKPSVVWRQVSSREYYFMPCNGAHFTPVIFSCPARMRQVAANTESNSTTRTKTELNDWNVWNASLAVPATVGWPLNVPLRINSGIDKLRKQCFLMLYYFILESCIFFTCIL